MKEYNSFLNFFFVKDKILQERRDRIFIGFILLFKYSILNLFSNTTSKQQYYKIFLHHPSGSLFKNSLFVLFLISTLGYFKR